MSSSINSAASSVSSINLESPQTKQEKSKLPLESVKAQIKKDQQEWLQAQENNEATNAREAYQIYLNSH